MAASGTRSAPERRSLPYETPAELPLDCRPFIVTVLHLWADTAFAAVQQHRPWLDQAPGYEERWLIARIVNDEMRQGWQLCRLLSEFGADGQALVRVLMDRREGEHAVAASNLPLERWSDVAALTALVGRVRLAQLRAFERATYAPLARVVPQMLAERQVQVNFGDQILRGIVAAPARGGPEEAQAAVDKWHPRALETFDAVSRPVEEAAARLGVIPWQGDAERQRYVAEARQALDGLGLRLPPEAAHQLQPADGTPQPAPEPSGGAS